MLLDEAMRNGYAFFADRLHQRAARSQKLFREVRHNDYAAEINSIIVSTVFSPCLIEMWSKTCKNVLLAGCKREAEIFKFDHSTETEFYKLTPSVAYEAAGSWESQDLQGTERNPKQEKMRPATKPCQTC